MAPAQIASAIGLPPGKRFSIKNMARLKKPRAAKPAGGPKEYGV